MALDSCFPAGMTAFLARQDLCITMSAERGNDHIGYPADLSDIPDRNDVVFFILTIANCFMRLHWGCSAMFLELTRLVPDGISIKISHIDRYFAKVTGKKYSPVLEISLSN